jgi:hypothetical protein
MVEETSNESIQTSAGTTADSNISSIPATQSGSTRANDGVDSGRNVGNENKEATLPTAQEPVKLFDYADVIAAGHEEGDGRQRLADQLRTIENFPQEEASLAEQLGKLELTQKQVDQVAKIISRTSKISSIVADGKAKEAQHMRAAECRKTIQEEFGNSGVKEAEAILSELSKEIDIPVDKLSQTVSSEVVIQMIKNRMSKKSQAHENVFEKFRAIPPQVGNANSEANNVWDAYSRARMNGTLWGRKK